VWVKRKRRLTATRLLAGSLQVRLVAPYRPQAKGVELAGELARLGQLLRPAKALRLKLCLQDRGKIEPAHRQLARGGGGGTARNHLDQDRRSPGRPHRALHLHRPPPAEPAEFRIEARTPIFYQ
jgi:hypothetical protein